MSWCKGWVVSVLVGVLVGGSWVWAQQVSRVELGEVRRQLQVFADKKDYDGAKQYIQSLVQVGQLEEVANSEKFKPSHLFFPNFADGKKLTAGGSTTHEYLKGYVFPYKSFAQIAHNLQPIAVEDQNRIGIREVVTTPQSVSLVAYGPQLTIFYRSVDLQFKLRERSSTVALSLQIPFYTLSRDFPNYSREKPISEIIRATDMSKYYDKCFSVVIPNQKFSVDNPIAAFNVSFYLPANSIQWYVSLLPVYGGFKDESRVVLAFPNQNDFTELTITGAAVFTNPLLKEPYTPQSPLTREHFDNLRAAATNLAVNTEDGKEVNVPIVVFLSDKIVFDNVGNQHTLFDSIQRMEKVPAVRVYHGSSCLILCYNFDDSRSIFRLFSMKTSSGSKIDVNLVETISISKN